MTNGESWPASLDALPDAALVLDEGGTVVAVNARLTALLQHDPSGRPLAELLRCQALEDAIDAPLCHARAEAVRSDGVAILVDVSAAAPHAGRRLVFLRGLDAPRLVAESERLTQVAFETAPVGMAFFATDGAYLRVNDALCRLLDRPAEELLGHRDQEFTHPAHRASDVTAARRILAGEIRTWQTEKRFVRPDGSIVWAIANMTFLRDEEGRALAWLGQFQDITERKDLEERLRRLADEDPLTGLPNRRGLEGEISFALEMSGRHQIHGAVLMIDLDGFKHVNDTHGHAVGDAALTAVAQALRARVRATALLARVGGDEFAVLLRATSGKPARVLADALGGAVRGTTLGPGFPAVALSASIGVADFGTPPLPSAHELLARADDAMYEAKRRGGDRRA